MVPDVPDDAGAGLLELRSSSPASAGLGIQLILLSFVHTADPPGGALRAAVRCTAAAQPTPLAMPACLGRRVARDAWLMTGRRGA